MTPYRLMSVQKAFHYTGFSLHRYHLFFQNVPDSTEWKFGITWGHITSTDMVHWEQLPVALEPGKVSQTDDTFFRWDADGCFTGCAVADSHGKPTILYTGPAILRRLSKKRPDSMTAEAFSAHLDSILNWCASAGVRLRNNDKAGPFPEGEDDTDMPFVEAQVCAAQADPDDEYHRVWTKMEQQALAESPPTQLRPANQHTGWRDPFLFEIPTPENDM